MKLLSKGTQKNAIMKDIQISQYIYTYKDQKCACFSILRDTLWKQRLELKKQARKSIDAFKLWGWRRLLRIPWTDIKTNQWIIKHMAHAHSIHPEI